ncbi:MAG: DUF4138 domain-containing protein [Bacteroidota bacterium]
MKKFLSILCMVLGFESIYAQRVVDTGFVNEIKTKQPFIYANTKAHRLKLSLNSIHVQDEIFWLGFSVRNKSSLSYPVDLIRLFTKDNMVTKRYSVQELDIVPIYTDAPNTIPAKSTTKFVMAVPKFTIPETKSCYLEMFEANGGRNLELEITNDALFFAKNVSVPVDSPGDTTTLDNELIKQQEYNITKAAIRGSRFIQVYKAYRYGKRMYLSCMVSNSWKKPFGFSGIKINWQKPDGSTEPVNTRMEANTLETYKPYSRREFVVSFPLIEPKQGDWLEVMFQSSPEYKLHDFMIRFNTRELREFDYVNRNASNLTITKNIGNEKN